MAMIARYVLALTHLPMFWLYCSDRRREPHVVFRINRSVPYRGACRILSEVVVSLPICRRTDGPGNKSAAAVGAYVVQYRVHAVSTERAFVGADPRICCIRRKHLVAVLAGWPQFKHDALTLSF